MKRKGRSDKHPYRDEEQFTPSQSDMLNELSVLLRRIKPGYKVNDLIVMLELPKAQNLWDYRNGQRRIEGKYHLKIEAILIDLLREKLELPAAFPRHIDVGTPSHNEAAQAV